MFKSWVIAALIVASSQSATLAQSPAPTTSHAVQLIKLPNGDYTVPMSALEGSGTSGKVTLHPEGPKTLVTVYTFGGTKRRHQFHLHAAKDCDVVGGGNAIPLAPAMTGQPSQTLVSLPLTNLTSKDYVVDAHYSTASQQFKEACARL